MDATTCTVQKEGEEMSDYIRKCETCKYRRAIVEAMKIGKICEEVKVVPIPKKLNGKSGTLYIIDEGETEERNADDIY